MRGVTLALVLFAAGLGLSAQTVFKGGSTPSASKSISISQVTGLTTELNKRPVKGAGYTAGTAARINSLGQIDSITGATTNCVLEDGTSVVCPSGGGGSSSPFVFVGVLASLPGTCNQSDLSFVTNATPGQQIYECSATNTWTQQLNSGVAGASMALDNLSSVSINTHLLPGTASIDVGASGNTFRAGYFSGTVTATTFSGNATTATALAANGTNCAGGTSFALGTDATGAAECGTVQTMVASGASHKGGLVPDPGVTSGTSKFLREDGTWTTPTGGGSVTSVALAVSSAPFCITGSPITASGTLTFAPCGTSGGVPYFSASNAMLSTPVLAANGAMVGGGAGGAPRTTPATIDPSSGDVVTPGTVTTATVVATGGASRLYLAAGTAPTNTILNGVTYDAVIYFDSADAKLKIRKLAGTVVILE